MTDVTVAMSTAVVTVDETSATVNVVGATFATVSVEQVVAPEVPFTVGGGTSGNQPTFSGSPLFSGSYILLDRLVHFRINVEMTNITNFGTGQYYVTLPFNSAHTYRLTAITLCKAMFWLALMCCNFSTRARTGNKMSLNTMRR
jgi:hypothetical protein